MAAEGASMASGTAASIRVRPRADGTSAFDVRYRIDGASRTMSFDTARAAERWSTIVRRVGAEQALTLLRERHSASGITLDEWSEKYLRGLSGIEGRTIDHYRAYMRTSISPALGALPLDAITRQAVAEWINTQAAVYAAKTVKNRHGFLSAMLQTAVREGLLARNPCADTRLPESEQREMVFLSIPEYLQLLSYVPDPYRLFVQLLAATGMRFGEATALRPGDFDLNAGTVRIARAWKSSKERSWYIGAPKTRRSRRTVSLPETLIADLGPALFDSSSEFAFVNARSGPIRQPTFWDGVWSPARRLANGQDAFGSRPMRGGAWDRPPAAVPMGKFPRVHDLRHSHVAWLVAAGIPLLTIQRRLGHESIQTTMDRYGHLSPDLLVQPAAAIDRILSSRATVALSN